MLTQQAMGWNRKKTENLHKVLAHRYIKVRAFCNGLKKKNYLSLFQNLHLSLSLSLLPLLACTYLSNA